MMSKKGEKMSIMNGDQYKLGKWLLKNNVAGRGEIPHSLKEVDGIPIEVVLGYLKDMSKDNLLHSYMSNEHIWCGHIDQTLYSEVHDYAREFMLEKEFMLSCSSSANSHAPVCIGNNNVIQTGNHNVGRSSIVLKISIFVALGISISVILVYYFKLFF